MRNWLALGFLIATCLTPAAGAAEGDPNTKFFNETFFDLKEELANAKAEGKQGIFVFFEMDECPFCHYMRVNVLNQPAVQAYYRDHFLNIAVDINGDVEMKDFEGNTTTLKKWAEKNRVRATPVLAFFDLNGQPTQRYTGRTTGTDEFIWLGEYVASGAYQDKGKSFTAYKREKKGS